MDFPAVRKHKPVIASNSSEAVFIGGATTGYASAVPTANQAHYVAFSLTSPFLVRCIWWVNGSAVAGTVDAGVYSSDGTRLVSVGATTQTTINVIQSVVLGTAMLLVPGAYWMAALWSSASGRNVTQLASNRDLAGQGLLTQAVGAATLPATATFASAVALATGVPLFGIAETTTI